MGEPLRATHRIHQKALFLVMEMRVYSDGFLQRLLVKPNEINQKTREEPWNLVVSGSSAKLCN